MLPFSFLSLGIRALPYLAAAGIAVWITANWMSWRNESALENQKEQLNLQCEAAKAVTNEVSNDYQKQLKVINARHAAAISRMLKHEQNKLQSGIPAAGHDATPAGNGVYRTVAIIDLGGEAEENTAKLMACQAYVNRVTQ